MREKKAVCKYLETVSDDSAREVLKIFLPVSQGYVNYNIAHSIDSRSQCDTWRLSSVYHYSENLTEMRRLTRPGAEWEMALKITDRPDFIGGYAHGDEVFHKIRLEVDGCERDIASVVDALSFDLLTFEVWSTGYDPSMQSEEAIKHYKKIIVDKNSVRVEQSVEWLNDYELSNAFMAMLPPLKEVTDSYYTNINPEKKPIPPTVSVQERGFFNELFLCGEAGFTFSLKVEKYLSDNDGKNVFSISDNGGVPYNKMYFPLQHKGFVNKGELWETATVYTIKN